jgi:hypothetical protein
MVSEGVEYAATQKITDEGPAIPGGKDCYIVDASFEPAYKTVSSVRPWLDKSER